MLEDHPNNYLNETAPLKPGVLFKFRKKLKLIELDIAFTKQRMLIRRRRER